MRNLVLISILLAGIAVGAYALLAERKAADPQTVPDAPEAQDADAGRMGRPVHDEVFYVEDREQFTAATNPAAVSAEAATFLKEHHEVYGVVLGGKARAYPVRWLAYHHAVNDTVGGVRVLIAYCVLCASGVSFDPVLGEQTLTFGVDGAWNGTATLFDHETGSVWLHLTGTCIRGTHAGAALARLPTGRHTTWEDWRRSHPTTDVMGPAIPLGSIAAKKAYAPMDRPIGGSTFFPPEIRTAMERIDPRLQPNALVYGVVAGGHAKAYALVDLRDAGLIDERLGGIAVTIWHDPASRSTAAFRSETIRGVLTFARGEDGTIEDRATGSLWTMEGTCSAGPLKGTRLRPVDGRLCEWYGWAGHHPKTFVWAP